MGLRDPSVSAFVKVYVTVPSNFMWVLDIKLSSLGLNGKYFTNWVIGSDLWYIHVYTMYAFIPYMHRQRGGSNKVFKSSSERTVFQFFSVNTDSEDVLQMTVLQMWMPCWEFVFTNNQTHSFVLIPMSPNKQGRWTGEANWWRLPGFMENLMDFYRPSMGL